MAVKGTSCFDFIKEKMGDRLDEETIRAIAQDIDNMRANFAKEITDDFDRWQKIKHDYVNRKKTIALSEKVEQLRNQIKSRNVADKLANFKSKEEGLIALISGRSKEQVPGSFVGADQLQRSRQNKWRGKLLLGLDHEVTKINGKPVSALDIVASGEWDKDMYRVLFELRSGGHIPDDIPKHIVDAAKVFKVIYNDILETQRRSGSMIGEIEGYAGRQTHDVDKIVGSARDESSVNEAFEKWSQFIIPKLDLNRTFGVDAGDEVKMKEFLRNAFDDIRHGKNRTAGKLGLSDELMTIGRAMKLGNKVDASRKIHFKNGEAAYDYNLEYGYKTLYENMIGAIDFHSRSSSLIDVFGTNPLATVNKFAREHGLTERDGSLKRSVQNNYNVVAGLTDAAGRSTLATVGRSIRGFTNFTRLWHSGINSISDLGTTISMMERHTGRGHFTQVKSVTENFFKNLSPERRKKIAEKALMATEIDLALTLNKVNVLDGDVKSGSRFFNLLMKAEQATFKYSGLNTVTATSKTTSSFVLMRDFAELTAKGYENLPDVIKKDMASYNISPGEFNAIAKSKTNFMGYEIVAPESILNMSDDTIKGIIGDADSRTINNYRERLSEKFAVFLSDVSDLASPTPGAREKAVLLQGASQDTYLGQGMRMVAQFKSFPVTMNSVIRRISDTSQRDDLGVFKRIFTTGAGARSMGTMMIYTTTMGYLAMSLRNILAGKEPPDPRDPEVMKEAMLKGGGAGIWADYLMADYDKNYRSLLSDAAGPAGGLAEDTAKLFAQGRTALTFGEEGKKSRDKMAGRLLNYAKYNLTPNIPVAGTAFKYFVLDELREIAAPGSRERALKNMRKRGERYYIPKLFDDNLEE